MGCFFLLVFSLVSCQIKADNNKAVNENMSLEDESLDGKIGNPLEKDNNNQTMFDTDSKDLFINNDETQIEIDEEAVEETEISPEIETVRPDLDLQAAVGLTPEIMQTYASTRGSQILQNHYTFNLFYDYWETIDHGQYVFSFNEADNNKLVALREGAIVGGSDRYLYEESEGDGQGYKAVISRDGLTKKYIYFKDYNYDCFYGNFYFKFDFEYDRGLYIENLETGQNIFLKFDIYFNNLLASVGNYKHQNSFSIYGKYIYGQRGLRLYRTDIFTGQEECVMANSNKFKYSLVYKHLVFYESNDQGTYIYNTLTRTHIKLMDISMERPDIYGPWLYFIHTQGRDENDRKILYRANVFSGLMEKIVDYSSQDYIKFSLVNEDLLYLTKSYFSESKSWQKDRLYLDLKEGIRERPINFMSESNIVAPTYVAMTDEKIFYLDYKSLKFMDFMAQVPDDVEGNLCIIDPTDISMKVVGNIFATSLHMEDETVYFTTIHNGDGEEDDLNMNDYRTLINKLNEDFSYEKVSDGYMPYSEMYQFELLEVFNTYFYSRYSDNAYIYFNDGSYSNLEIHVSEDRDMSKWLQGQSATARIYDGDLYMAVKNQIYRYSLVGEDAELIHTADTFITSLEIKEGVIYYAGNGLYKTILGQDTYEVLDDRFICDFMVDKDVLIYQLAFYMGDTYYYKMSFDGILTGKYLVDDYQPYYILTKEKIYTLKDNQELESFDWLKIN